VPLRQTKMTSRFFEGQFGMPNLFGDRHAP
jgi:hypothetical protein